MQSEGVAASTGTVNTTETMRDAVFFDGPDVQQRLSRFWILIVLSSIIAAAGVAADSSATVIGAMIVAPLMTPILGTMLSVVLADRINLTRSFVLALGGVLTAIAIGWLFGFVFTRHGVAAHTTQGAGRVPARRGDYGAGNATPADDGGGVLPASAMGGWCGCGGPAAAGPGNNSQVAGRVQPRLVDLGAAIATGAVGSIALVRRDISGTLPGVAIAISLVPPLSVVGLTFEAGAWGQSFGALTLFLTNVAAILGTGTVVMALYGVHRMVVPTNDPGRPTINRRNAIVAIAVMLVAVSIPLTTTSITIARDNLRESQALAAARSFGDAVGWRVVNTTTRNNMVLVHMEGPPPMPDTGQLETELEKQGVDPADVRVELVPARTVTFD
ncbi:MAG: DUF389 domain-containing protein [Rubrobacteraceae bacterium]